MRLFVGLLFACHGAQKVLGWFPKPGQAPAPPDMLMTVGGWIELICGLLIAIGLLTRARGFPGQWHDGGGVFHGPRRAAVFSPSLIGESSPWFTPGFFFSYFSTAPGRWSVDAMMRRGTLRRHFHRLNEPIPNHLMKRILLAVAFAFLAQTLPAQDWAKAPPGKIFAARRVGRVQIGRAHDQGVRRLSRAERQSAGRHCHSRNLWADGLGAQRLRSTGRSRRHRDRAGFAERPDHPPMWMARGKRSRPCRKNR